MKNTVNTTIARVKAAGFTVVEGLTGGQKTTEVDVDFEEFLKLPVTAVPVVFSYTMTFDESDLQYTLEDPRTLRERFKETGKVIPEDVDLTELEPALKNYQSYLGMPSFVALAAPLNGILVKTYVAEPWYDEVSTLISEAEARAEEQAEQRREQDKARQAAQLESQLQKLRLLLDDGDFLKLARVKATAQRTLISVAKQKYPEAAAALGEPRLKELIAELRDQVMLASTNR